MWCLSEVDYDYVDLKTYLYTQPDLVSTSKVKEDDKPTRGLKNLVAPSRAGSSHNANGSFTSETALIQLREALLFQDPKTSTVSSIIANWPCSTLKLSEVIRPEEVKHRMSHEEQLWSWIFQGVASRTARCKMTTLNLTSYKPGDGLIYLLTGIVPLLALSPDDRKLSILLPQIKSSLKIGDSGLIDVIESYLKVLLNHKLFQKDRRLVIPEDTKLEIIFDFFPISRTRLAHLSFLVSIGLSSITHVHISSRTAIISLTATNGNKVPPDDSLEILKYYTVSQKALTGLYFDGICEEDHLRRIAAILDNNRHLVSIGMNCSHSSLFKLAASPLYDAAIFQKISTLVRLELRELDLSGELEQLFTHLPETIEYLGIPGCQIGISDIMSCRDCRRENLLREFNMANVYVHDSSKITTTPHTTKLSNLFRLMHNVVVLNLSALLLVVNTWDEFQSGLSHLNKLQVLILDKIPLTEYQVNLLLDLCILKLSELRKLVLTYYDDCLHEDKKMELLQKIGIMSQSTNIDITVNVCR